MFTQQQIDDAAAQAREAGKAEATAQFAAASDAIVQENAALKAAAAKAAIDAKLDAWTADGKMLPAARAGHAAFMAQLAALPVTCAFAVGDEADAPKHTPAEYFAALMDAKAPVINLRGAGTQGAGDAAPAPLTDVKDIVNKAQAYMETQAKLGVIVGLPQAITHVGAGGV